MIGKGVRVRRGCRDVGVICKRDRATGGEETFMFYICRGGLQKGVTQSLQ